MDGSDGHGHGTHVAGTVGAVGNNNLGIAGLNWNVKLMSIKFLDDTGRGNTADAGTCAKKDTMMCKVLLIEIISHPFFI